MVRKLELTQEEKEFIRHHYGLAELSISEISRQLGYDRGVIMRNAKEMGLEKVFPKGSRGKKYNWTPERDNLLIELYQSNQLTVVDIAEKLGTSADSTTKRARTLGVWKNAKIPYTEEDLAYIKDRAQSMSIGQIANHIGLSHEFVRQKISEMGLTNLYFDKKKEQWELKRRNEERRIEEFYKNRKRPGTAPIDDDNFLWDLSNPHYTTFDLGEKYDLSPSTVGIWRNKLLGKMRATPKQQNSMTELETKISRVLIESFDITYFFEHKIGKWNVDFYLGNKKIIEAQGVRWHASEKVKEKDERKFNELTDLGYSILYIHELDFEKNQDEVEKQILGFLQQ